MNKDNRKNKVPTKVSYLTHKVSTENRWKMLILIRVEKTLKENLES